MQTKKVVVVFSLLLLTIALLPSFAHASTTVTLTPSSGDAYVRSDNPDTNYGSAWDIHVNGGNPVFGFVKFDLSSIPVNSAIISAYLKLDTGEGAGGTQSLYVYRVEGSWEESTLTFNNKPSIAGTPTVTDTAFYTSGTGYHSWTVTSDVQAFVTGTPNNGWCLKLSDWWVSFHSKDGGQSSRYPQLEITYEVPPDGVIPEVPFGTLLGVAVCFAAFVVFVKKPKLNLRIK